MASPGKPRMASRQAIRNKLILPRRVLVLIERDMAEIASKIVFEHEYDILGEIHGEGQVTLVQDPLAHNLLIATPDVLAEARDEMEKALKKRQKVQAVYMHAVQDGEWVTDPDHPDAPPVWEPRPVYVEEEMQRLRSVYGMDQEKKEHYVDLVYPHEGVFLEAAGGEYKPPRVANAA